MKGKEEIKKRIKELQESRKDLSKPTKSKINFSIGELIWVLDE